MLDLANYIPYLLSSVNNALSRGASQRYLEDFNIGIVEWRVLSMLAIEPGIQASRVCDVIHLDKGAASRALTALEKKGLLKYEVLANDPRKRVWWHNEAGRKLHDSIMEVALAREELLITGVDPEELEVFLKVFRQMHRNLDTFD